MPYTVLPITFAVPPRPELPGLILEQAPWAGGVGVVTKLDLVHALSSALYGDPENEIDCGMDGDCYLSGLFVYPFNPSLSYQIGITHGELGESITQDVEVRELVSFKLDTEATVKYPIQQLISAEWGAETWDSEGGVTSDPSIFVDGQQVVLSKKVYGTVIVIYKTIRHARTLRVPPREESVENVFDSYAWARWDGGVEMEKLDPPENAEEAYFSESNCIWGGRWGDVIPPDDPGEPYGDGYGEDYDIDYCTQRIIERYV